MFEKLKNALTSLSTSVTQKTLTESEIEKVLWDFEIALLESDVAEEVVDGLVGKVKNELIGVKLQRSTSTLKYLNEQLSQIIRKYFFEINKLDLLQLIEEKRGQKKPFIIVFLGINGTGKTTTVAKLTHFFKKRGHSVVLSCSDTHRPGAIEQLSEHANRLDVKAVYQRYGADPAAVARDTVAYANNHDIDIVMVDTAGRMQTNRNLMDEVSKIIRVIKPDLRIFIGDALAGNDAVSQAKEFLKYTGFDAVILTKVDADSKGGAALSITYTTRKPIIFVGGGQSYDDLTPFKPEEFISTLLN